VLVGIHQEPKGYFSSFLQRYEVILDYNGIDHMRMDVSDQDFWQRVAGLDLFIIRPQTNDGFHLLALSIIPVIETHMGIKALPNMDTYWHYDDKIRQYYLLTRHGFPIVETWIFWDEKKALEWVEEAAFPKVFKLKGGAGSENVRLVKTKDDAKRLIGTAFHRGFPVLPGYFHDTGTKISKVKSKKELLEKACRMPRVYLAARKQRRLFGLDSGYVYFQKFLPDNLYDTRITVIGERAFGFRRLVRTNDFRASGSGKINWAPDAIDGRCVDMAFDISKKLRFQCMAYDFLYDENHEPKVCEISWTFVDSAVYQCPGYWDEGRLWHEGHYWPQYCQLMDQLNLPDLKQPAIIP
jgi:glutathione synthase/RimK-type ligase-like ATP-grasp enzyme